MIYVRSVGVRVQFIAFVKKNARHASKNFLHSRSYKWSLAYVSRCVSVVNKPHFRPGVGRLILVHLFVFGATDDNLHVILKGVDHQLLSARAFVEWQFDSVFSTSLLEVSRFR